MANCSVVPSNCNNLGKNGSHASTVFQMKMGYHQCPKCPSVKPRKAPKQPEEEKQLSDTAQWKTNFPVYADYILLHIISQLDSLSL